MYDHCGQSHQKKNKVKRINIKYRASTFYHIWRGGHIPPVELNQSGSVPGGFRVSPSESPSILELEYILDHWKSL